MVSGLIHVYTGDGKGKTTAAVGIAIRARSSGLRTLFAQFLKEKDSGSEISLLNSVGITTIVFDAVKSPFFNPEIDTSFLRDEARDALSRLEEIFSENRFDLVVLDEFICLVRQGILSEEEAVEFLKKKPKTLEIVLTGTGVTDRLIDLADYVTFMKNIKHPYAKNMKARKGIEF